MNVNKSVRNINYRCFNGITYTCPVAAFSDAYGNAQVWRRTYALEIAKKMGTVLVPDMDDVVKLEHIAYENGVDENSSDTDFYWLLNEMEIPMDIDGLGDISIAGANIEVQYNNLKAGTATISMQEDNFSFATNQSGQKDAEVSYLFYNESDITKVTIRESEQDNSLEVCNKDEKIYFKGLNSAEIKTETGDYDENGDFVPRNSPIQQERQHPCIRRNHKNRCSLSNLSRKTSHYNQERPQS